MLGGHAHGILTAVLKSVDNLRSAVAKNAILTIADMWIGLGKSMDPELVLAAPVLLKRFADINGFLNEVAEECISTIIEHASPARMLSAILSSATSKLPTVRAKAANVACRCVEVMPEGKLNRTRELEKLLSMLPQFCQDKNGETRTNGRQIAALLIKRGIVGDDKMQMVLPGDVYQRVEQSLRTGLYSTPAKRLSLSGANVNASIDSTITMDDLGDDSLGVSGLNFSSPPGLSGKGGRGGRGGGRGGGGRGGGRNKTLDP